MPTPEARAARAKHSARTVLIASLSNILFTIVAMGIFFGLVDRADSKIERESKARAEQIEADREARSIQTCHQYNKDQTRRREYQSELIPAVMRNLGSRTEAEIAELIASDGFQAHLAFVIESYPYRNCSPECVEAHLSDDIPDCKPAATEAGTV